MKRIAHTHTFVILKEDTNVWITNWDLKSLKLKMNNWFNKTFSFLSHDFLWFNSLQKPLKSIQAIRNNNVWRHLCFNYFYISSSFQIRDSFSKCQTDNTDLQFKFYRWLTDWGILPENEVFYKKNLRVYTATVQSVCCSFYCSRIFTY